MAEISMFNPEIQFHLLRHFTEPPENYIAKLASALQLAPGRLLEECRLPGSKFSAAFAKHPEILYERIRESPADRWQTVYKDENKRDYLISFDKKEWPQGIGRNALAPLAEIDPRTTDSITLKKRGNFFVQTLKVDQLPQTSQLVLVADPAGTVITVFPGPWLPALTAEIVSQWVFLYTGKPDEIA